MWQWREKTPFAHTVVVGDQVFIGGQQALDNNGVVLNPGDIAAQTRNVFENMNQNIQNTHPYHFHNRFRQSNSVWSFTFGFGQTND